MPRWAAKTLTGWGGYCKRRVHRPGPSESLSLWGYLSEAGSSAFIVFGARRSYGDAALNLGGGTVVMNLVNRFPDFDASSGKLVAEAGMTLSDVITTTP